MTFADTVNLPIRNFNNKTYFGIVNDYNSQSEIIEWLSFWSQEFWSPEFLIIFKLEGQNQFYRICWVEILHAIYNGPLSRTISWTDKQARFPVYCSVIYHWIQFLAYVFPVHLFEQSSEDIDLKYFKLEKRRVLI